MCVKCYLVEINTDNESMFDFLRDFGFIYHVHPFDDFYYEIEVIAHEKDLRDLEAVMQWYV